MTLFTQERANGMYHHMYNNCWNKTHADISWYYNQAANDLALLTRDEWKKQIKNWKSLNMKCVECNNKEFVIHGKTWYCLVAQKYDGEVLRDTGMDGHALMISGLMVTGFVYWFDSKTMRNKIFKEINKN